MRKFKVVSWPRLLVPFVFLGSAKAFAMQTDGVNEYIIGEHLANLESLNEDFSCSSDYAYETRQICVSKSPKTYRLANYHLNSLQFTAFNGKIASVTLSFDWGFDPIERSISMGQVRQQIETKLGEAKELEKRGIYTMYTWKLSDYELTTTEESIFYVANNYEELREKDALRDW